MKDRDQNRSGGDPIVSDAGPGGPAAWFANVRSAFEAMRTPDSKVPGLEAPSSLTAPPAGLGGQAAPTPRAAKPKPPKAQKPVSQEAAISAAAETKAAVAVHGRPMIWMTPVFLVPAVVFGLPGLARWLEPTQPRAVLGDLISKLPEMAHPLSTMVAGWLWAPWWIVLPAFYMHVRGALAAGKAIMDAVGWGMAALAILGAAWLFWGRKALEAGAFSAAERTGAWQLLVAEFVFLLLVATVLGPNTPQQKTRFEQG